jgi:hypothetical protein
MSIAARPNPDAVSVGWSRRLPATAELVVATLLSVVAVVLVHRWWSVVQQVAVPLPRGVLDLPPSEHLHQLPGLAVVGLLVVRGVALKGHRTIATQHLAEMAARWSWLWLAASFVALACAASKLTGEPVAALLGREDLLAVLARSDRATALVATIWVALVVALFAPRLTSTGETLALVVLAAATLLPVLPALPGAGHGPDAGHVGQDLHGLALVALTAQLLALVVWLGALVAIVLHLRAHPIHLRRALMQFSRTASWCVLVAGSAALTQTILTLSRADLVWQSSGGQLVIGKGVALLLLAAVGYRHRRRTADAVVSSRLLPLLRLVVGEVVLGGAVVAITMLIVPTL